MSSSDKKSVTSSAAAKESNQSITDTAAQVTPARLFRDRAGSSLLTRTQLELRFDHAAAVDAVYEDRGMAGLLPADLIRTCGLFELQTEASGKTDYLRHPELGRRLSGGSESQLLKDGTPHPEIQLFVGDGLSAAAVCKQVPRLLPLLLERFQQEGWSVGRPFFVRYCRVGVLNHVGAILKPRVAILLIGERPGLSTAESLSAYMAYQPGPHHSDADRNLLSNIHDRGITAGQAVDRITAFTKTMLQLGRSGVEIKEDPLWQAASPLPAPDKTS